MLRPTEEETRDSMAAILSRIEGGVFGCRERKQSRGRSSIAKPADLEVFCVSDPDRVVVAVEVANVNTTQLVGEVTRLYYDCCPVKLLILFPTNNTIGVREQCEKLFCLLYGQNDIHSTPARVEWHDMDDQIEASLRMLLQR